MPGFHLIQLELGLAKDAGLLNKRTKELIIRAQQSATATVSGVVLCIPLPIACKWLVVVLCGPLCIAYNLEWVGGSSLRSFAFSL